MPTAATGAGAAPFVKESSPSCDDKYTLLELLKPPRGKYIVFGRLIFRG